MKTWTFQNGIYVESSGTVAGPKEAAGPLSESFDQTYQDLYCGEESWELAERKLMEDAITHALKKANRKQEDIDRSPIHFATNKDESSGDCSNCWHVYNSITIRSRPEQTESTFLLRSFISRWMTS